MRSPASGRHLRSIVLVVAALAAMACGSTNDSGSAPSSDAATDAPSSDAPSDSSPTSDAPTETHDAGDAIADSDGGACPTIAADTTLADRKAKALVVDTNGFDANRPYTKGDRNDCLDFGTDAYGLVAKLELGSLGLAGGLTPGDGATIAQHIASLELPTIGTSAPGRCTFGASGSPAPEQAAAALAYAMVRYGGAWSPAVKESIRALVEDGAWGGVTVQYLTNGSVDLPVSMILVGEALGRTTLLSTGTARLQQMIDHLASNGGIEENAPLYTTEHFVPLAFLWQATKDPKIKAQAQIALDYELLMEAHLYLPGGGLSTPKSRDYSGGVGNGGGQSMLPAIQLVTNDTMPTVDVSKAYPYTLFAAATDYVLPETIRSIFIDKGEGYDFACYTDIQQGASRTPNAVYDLGLGGAQVNPQETVVLPGGAASTGVAYGWREVSLGVFSGTQVRAGSKGFGVLYQYQPWVCGDTDDLGNPIGGCGGGSLVNDLPYDFLSELYDYERMTYARTAISIWDPTLDGKGAGVVRTNQETVVHLPDWASLGGETKTAGKWRVGKLGEVYVAYAPLGTISEELTMSETAAVGGSYTRLRLAGVSGGVIELATTKDFATIDAYATDLSARALRWTASPPSVEVDALDPTTGTKHLARLEYRPEKRFVDGAEISVASALDHGLMSSPWMKWDATKKTLTVSRACYPTIVYDFENATVTVSGG